MRVVLVRHGATEWSENGRHTSTTDLPLTEQGRLDAAALAPVLAGERFVVVACSPRSRSAETCRLAGLHGAAETWDDLVEWDYGAYEGITTADICADRPGWELFRDGCPGGESPADVGARADRVIERVLAAPDGGDVAVFSHGHFLRVLGARWAGWPVEAGLHLLLDTGTLSVLGDKRGDRVIQSWNAAVSP
jgi:probable phosphoglycerate mutase